VQEFFCAGVFLCRSFFVQEFFCAEVFLCSLMAAAHPPECVCFRPFGDVWGPYPGHIPVFLASTDELCPDAPTKDIAQVFHARHMSLGQRRPCFHVRLLELRKAFTNHSRFHRQDGAAWSGDHHPIKMAGYTVSKINVCKVCDKPAKKDTCGDHYDSRNRKRVNMIEGMRLRKRERPCVDGN